MPRISIIVAHQNDQRLEDTLLSILENRPRDCEIIVAHDGSYSDPYQLADEVLFVETGDRASRVAKLNEGLYAACSPVVHLLAEGVLVSEGWCEGPIQKISRQQAVAVAPLIETTGSNPSIVAGLDASKLSKRAVQQVRGSRVPENCGAPTLAAGFYSRRLLLALGGLIEAVDSCVADVDMALSLVELGLSCEVDTTSHLIGKPGHVAWRRDAGTTRDLASLLAAHHQHASGTVAGIKGAMHLLMTNIVNPGQWASAMAWGAGLASNALESQVADRLTAYRKAQAAQAGQSSLPLRRAA